MQTLEGAFELNNDSRWCRYLASLAARGVHTRSCLAGSIWPHPSSRMQLR